MSRPRPIPGDARNVLPTMTPSESATHYGVSLDTIRRWQQALGVQCQRLTTERRAEIARRIVRKPPAPRPATHDEPWHPDLFRAAMQAFNRAFGGRHP